MNQSGSSLIEMMVAITVLGIVISGTYEGLGMVNRDTAKTLRGTVAQEIAERAVVVLENLPADSIAIADDTSALDLHDIATPDKINDPINGGEWTISQGPANYRVFYNIARDTKVVNMAEIRVFVAWMPDGTAPAFPVQRQWSVQRVLFRGVAPL